MAYVLIKHNEDRHQYDDGTLPIVFDVYQWGRQKSIFHRGRCGCLLAWWGWALHTSNTKWFYVRRNLEFNSRLRSNLKLFSSYGENCFQFPNLISRNSIFGFWGKIDTRFHKEPKKTGFSRFCHLAFRDMSSFSAQVKLMSFPSDCLFSLQYRIFPFRDNFS